MFDFNKKRADKVQLFGRESLDEDGNLIPFIEQAALVTHYLQLRDSNVNMPYANKAQDILELWYEFIQGEKEQRPNDFVGVSESLLPIKHICFQSCFKRHFLLRRIQSSRLLIFLLELVDSEWHFRIWEENVSFHQNGMNRRKKPIMQIMEKFHLGI